MNYLITKTSKIGEKKGGSVEKGTQILYLIKIFTGFRFAFYFS